MSSFFKRFFYFFNYLIVLIYLKWGDFIDQYAINHFSLHFVPHRPPSSQLLAYIIAQLYRASPLVFDVIYKL